MSNAAIQKQEENKAAPQAVVAIIDIYLIVINRGTGDGVSHGQKFLLYELGEEIVDPNTSESLGRLEIPKGTGEVIHVQERMATLQSNTFESPQRKIVKRGSTLASLMGEEEEEVIPSDKRLAFRDPKVGDRVKRIG